ncbi:hypothetical protein [Streptomyces sasae]|uniref:hypothetical protein n=1 Tax=Streptomyces sasae TaxID=1266772 RepID=UPI00292D244B|nr:hypothetical protein [Streptomyces sasae]
MTMDVNQPKTADGPPEGGSQPPEAELTPEAGPQAREAGPQTPEGESQASEAGPQASEAEPQLPEGESQAPKAAPQAPEVASRLPEVEPQTLDVASQLPEAGPRTLDVASQLPEAALQVPAKDRRLLRSALRWVSAVAVFAVVGSGTAYGITRLDRTDVPGLATHSDGRWNYPVLVKPPLPSGSPGPNDDTRNPAGTHYADLRELVLPAPKGATVDASLKGADGWLPTKSFLAEFATAHDRGELGQKLVDNGLRHIAARGWTTPDGTRTRIYLLQFGTAAVAEDMLNKQLMNQAMPTYGLRDGDSYELDGHYPDQARMDDVLLAPYRELQPYGAAQARQAYLATGDTVGVVIQSRKGEALAVPFQQTVTLQSELLS